MTLAFNPSDVLSPILEELATSCREIIPFRQHIPSFTFVVDTNCALALVVITEEYHITECTWRTFIPVVVASLCYEYAYKYMSSVFSPFCMTNGLANTD